MRLPFLDTLAPARPMLASPSRGNDADPLAEVKRHMGCTIGAALANAGVECHLKGRHVIVAPRVLTFPFWPYNRAAVPWDRLSKLAPSIEGQTGYAPIRIRAEGSEAGSWIMVEAPNPMPDTLLAPDAPLDVPDNRKLRVPVGVDSRNRVWHMTLSAQDVPHFALVGPSGVGKTTVAWGIAYQLARLTAQRVGDLLMLAVCSDPTGWENFEGLSQWAGTVYHADAAPVIDWLWRTVERREANRIQHPAIVAFLDDYAGLLTHIDNGQVEHIARNGRRVHVHLIINAHQMDGANMGKLPSLLPDRGIFGQASGQASAQATGRSKAGANALLGQGDMLVVSNRIQGEAPRLATYLVTPRDIERLSGRGQPHRPPWQEPVVKVAGRVIEPTPRLRIVKDEDTPIHSSASAIDNAPGVVLDDKARQVRDMILAGHGMKRIVTEVWNVKPGGGQGWTLACQEYQRINQELVRGGGR